MARTKRRGAARNGNGKFQGMLTATALEALLDESYASVVRYIERNPDLRRELDRHALAVLEMLVKVMRTDLGKHNGDR